MNAEVQGGGVQKENVVRGGRKRRNRLKLDSYGEKSTKELSRIFYPLPLITRVFRLHL